MHDDERFIRRCAVSCFDLAGKKFLRGAIFVAYEAPFPARPCCGAISAACDIQNVLKVRLASLLRPRDNPILGKTLDNALRENIMIQQAYYTPKFAGQAQATRRPSLLRAVFNYFRKGWDNNLVYAEVVGKSGSYLG